jgi:hypothetical protein
MEKILSGSSNIGICQVWEAVSVVYLKFTIVLFALTTQVRAYVG